MAKAKTKHLKEGDVQLKFVGDAVDDAVAKMEKGLAKLPANAKKARATVKFAIAGVKFVASTTKVHCGPTWFMPSK